MPRGGFIIVKSPIGNEEMMFPRVDVEEMEGTMGVVERKSIDKGRYWSLVFEVVVGRMERRWSF